ncbi:MAG: SDR family oxidoreductase [Gemmatimonadota bacterium]
MELGLNGKTALVAASSQGLGRAAAEELAAEGADLVLCARTEETLRQTAEEIRGSTGVEVLAVPTDLTEPPAVERLVAAALEAFGGVDILVTNAGGPPAGGFEEQTPEAWREAVKLLLESAVNLTRWVLPGMKERGWGRIITVTSIAVKQPVDGLFLSNSVRSAVAGFARSLANEVAPFGITVNNVLPGYTRTARVEELAERLATERGASCEEVIAAWEAEIPMGRLAETPEFAALVAFLASDRAAYITGTSIPVDGGWVRSLL